jgi:hypothetical protein
MKHGVAGMQKDIKVAFLLSVMAMGAGLIALAISPLVDNDPLIHGVGVITLIVGAIGGIVVMYTVLTQI